MIISIIIASIILFIMWVVLADVRKFADKEKYPPYVVAPALLYGFAFILVDIAYNLTIGSVIFMQLPKELTLTARLKRNLKYPVYAWRYRLSYFTCKRLVSPWAPNHCGLGLG